MSANAELAIGFDIGGTKVEGSLIQNDGAILSTLREPAPKSNAEMLQLITQLTETIAAGRAIAGVGFSIPGSIDPLTGRLRNAPNSPAIDGTAMPADLAARLPHRLAFENDANCLTLSEASFGVARGFRNLVGIILGTGVGGGVLIEGRLLHGSRGLAPEPGHMPLLFGGRRCGCGNLGCVEAYLSGPSILARFREAGGDSSIVDTRAIFEARQNATACAIVEETLAMYARFIGALISLYDPEAFVLGGGLSLQPLFYQCQERIAQIAFGSRDVPAILPAKNGDTSGKLGAAALIFHPQGL